MFRSDDNDTAKISIVVPVYNVDQYLERCVDSLLNQTYHNYEIILVDDGSTDKCQQICDDYAKRYDNVKAYHKSNGGLSDARNYGIERCESEYVVLIDSDDKVDDNMLELLMDARNRTKADIICSPLIFEFPNGNRKKVSVFEETVVDSVTAQAYILRSKYSGVSACAKLFPLTVLKKHPYPVGEINEDLRTTFWHFQEVDKVAFIPNAFYHYIQRSNSIMYDQIEISTILDAISICDQFIAFSKNEQVRKSCINRIFQLAGNYSAAHSKISFNTRRVLQKKIRSYLLTALKDEDNTLSEKLKFILLGVNDISFRVFMFLQKRNRERYIKNEDSER